MDSLNSKILMRGSKNYTAIHEATIVEYKPDYQKAFKALNIDWITKYVNLTYNDLRVLDDPKKHILDNHGYIFIALVNNQPVGSCALIKNYDSVYNYELAKMAVSSEVRGKGIGKLLCKTAVEKARELGAKRIYLQTNTILRAAIHLYLRLGFREYIGPPDPDERCNVFMEYIFDK